MKNAYLMTSATLMPAFAAVAIRMAMQKRGKLNMVDLLLFAGISVIAGFYSARLLKEDKKPDMQEA